MMLLADIKIGKLYIAKIKITEQRSGNTLGQWSAIVRAVTTDVNQRYGIEAKIIVVTGGANLISFNIENLLLLSFEEIYPYDEPLDLLKKMLYDII